MARAKRLSPAVPAPAAPETGGTLTIDLAAIEANWRALAHQLLTVECAAVVKANAYGLGLEAGDGDAREGRLQDFLRRRSRRSARACDRAAREATIYVLNGFTPDWGDGLYRDQCAAGDQQHDRACGMGRLRRAPTLGRAAPRSTSTPA